MSGRQRPDGGAGNRPGGGRNAPSPSDEARRFQEEAEQLALDAAVADLAATRVFGLMSLPSLRRLATRFGEIDLGPGQVLTRQGEVDGSVWIVTDGTLAIEHRQPGGRTERLGAVGYGSVIGLRGVFIDEARSNSLVAIDPTRLRHIDRDALWAALAADTDALDKIILPDTARFRLASGPSDRSFPGERTVGEWRRHWFALLKRMFLPIGIFAVSIVVAASLSALAASPAAVAALALLGLTLPALVTVWAVYDYLHDRLIVTNHRIIHIEQTPLIESHRAEAFLSRIQDVRVTSPDMIARLLGFGTIIIQTAGSARGIRFEQVPDPESVRDAIFAQVEGARSREKGERRSRIEQRVREALGMARPAPGLAPGEGTSAADEAESGAADGSAPENSRLRPLSMLGAIIQYFWPLLRVERGGTVTWRKHWWVLIRSTWFWILPFLALGGVLVVAGLAAVAGIVPPLPSDAGPGLGGVPASYTELLAWASGLPIGPLFWIWGILAFILLFQYEDWRNDYYVLTDAHLIDVEARPLGLFAERRQASISQIQDISYRVPSILATFLNFGDVVIETAAESGNFTFDSVYHPALVQQEIFERISRHRDREQQAEEKRQSDEMSRWLAAYHRVTGGESGALDSGNE